MRTDKMLLSALAFSPKADFRNKWVLNYLYLMWYYDTYAMIYVLWETSTLRPFGW